MPEPVAFYVPGLPAPQGSKSHVGGGRMIESSKRLKPWRAEIAAVARDAFAGLEPLEGPVKVTAFFDMKRPLATPKNREVPAIKRPDVDKLARAALDAVTGIAFNDDSQVVELDTRKRLASLGDGPGLTLRIEGSTWT